MSTLAGKTVLVSGVGPGLGRHIAEVALREGANVVIGARSEDRLRKLAEELDPSDERVAVAPLDITSADACVDAVGVALDRFGRLDSIVHCAAYTELMGGLEGVDLEEFRPVFDTNVFGTLRLTQAALPALKREGGSIVVIGSQSMFLPRLMQLAYAASKASLRTAAHLLAVELGPYRIRVNTVVATWMWGPAVQGYVAWEAENRGVSEDEIVAEIAGNMPLGEIPEDGDVAEAVVFLASDRARAISGQTLFVNAAEYLH
jgi:NAD(P)-dependent dehydrogenase (short-subunit alcohol dehydrogenase family)